MIPKFSVTRERTYQNFITILDSFLCLLKFLFTESGIFIENYLSPQDTLCKNYSGIIFLFFCTNESPLSYSGSTGILIHNAHIEAWKKTKEELINIAQQMSALK